MLGVPCEFRKLTLNLRGGMGGVEAQAREARYAALHEMAAETGCSVIATAHTLNDQAETLLMRLGSGTGLLGARGILRKSGIVVRPMRSGRAILDSVRPASSDSGESGFHSARSRSAAR